MWCMHKPMDPIDWNQRFSGKEYFYGIDPNTFVAEMASRIPVGPVLCLAEGEGRNAVHLATLGHAVTAVDQSETGLAKAQRLATSRQVKIETLVADLNDFQIQPDSWSGVIATFAHLPPALRRRIHAEVVAGLRRGGVFIMEAYTPAQLAYNTGGPKDPELLMTLTGLRYELKGLEFEIGREIQRNVVEGCGHRGRAAVVQIAARRPA